MRNDTVSLLELDSRTSNEVKEFLRRKKEEYRGTFTTELKELIDEQIDYELSMLFLGALTEFLAEGNEAHAKKLSLAKKSFIVAVQEIGDDKLRSCGIDPENFS